MITHIVLFKLKDASPENVARMKSALQLMRGKIPELKSIDVGADIVRSERSYDLALVAKFDTMKDLDAYIKHPAHVTVAEMIRQAKESSVSVDFES